MLARLSLFLGCLCTILLVNAAEPDATPPKPIAIRKVTDLTGIAWDYDKKVDQPLVIDSAKKLSEEFEDKATQAKINAVVDLSKERLIVLTWSGSGKDQLALVSADTMNMGNTVFAYKPGLTRDLRQHTHIYVMPQGTKFDVRVPK
jgi:ATP-dependent protease Clp ATPase subunit